MTNSQIRETFFVANCSLFRPKMVLARKGKPKVPLMDEFPEEKNSERPLTPPPLLGKIGNCVNLR